MRISELAMFRNRESRPLHWHRSPKGNRCQLARRELTMDLHARDTADYQPSDMLVSMTRWASCKSEPVSCM